MRRREFLRASTAGGIASGARGLGARRRPNVILVLTDDQGYGDLSCHGNPVLKTPNLDAFQRDSVRFTDFHVNPLCAPTRAALMTGRYPFRGGVSSPIGGWSNLRRNETTMAEVFTANGYRTALYGKWHLGDDYPYRPHDRGFEDALTFGGGAITCTADHWGNKYFDDTYWRNGRPEKCPGYCTDVFFRRGLEFVEKNRDRPFLLALTLNAPHSPFLVEEKYSRPYLAAGLPPNLAGFYGMIANLDENFGLLRARLRQLRLDENTILIFLTDNGTALDPTATGQAPRFNAGMRSFKMSPYDGGHRVPFFIRWPGGGIAGGKDIRRLAADIDVLPTLIELAGLEATKSLPQDGISLAPLLRGRGDFPSGRLYFAQHAVGRVKGRVGTLDDLPPFENAAVLSEDWRLVEGRELFDARRDPGQTRDVAAAQPEVLSKLRKAYEEWFAGARVTLADVPGHVIGARQQQTARITCFDWHTENWYAWQKDIEARVEMNGFWVVEVAQDGAYTITLREFPEEAPPSPLRAATARLKIGSEEAAKPVQEGAESVSFEVRLKAGRTRLQTWLSEKRGAYYVYARRSG